MLAQKKIILFLAFTTISLHAILMVPTLETERCTLRPLSVNDMPDIFSLASDPDIARYTSFFGQTLHQTHEETYAFIQRCLRMHFGEYGMNWVITEKYSGIIIGAVTLFGYSAANRKAEIGYCLSPAYWNMGIMTEVNKMIIIYVFTELNLVRLQATVDPKNIGCEQVLKKCGMQYEGLLRNYYIVRDACCNRAMYALTREEFFTQYQKTGPPFLVSQSNIKSSNYPMVSDIAHFVAVYLHRVYARIHPSP